MKHIPYWLYIDSYVHISIKKSGALLYNPLNGNILEYSCNDENKTILSLIRKLSTFKNHRVISLTPEQATQVETVKFIEQLRINFMGDVIEKSASSVKPFQVIPYVKIQRDMNILKKNPNTSPGDKMMTYLDELIIFINNRCSQSCPSCDRYFLQVPCCTAKPAGESILSPRQIASILDETRGSHLDAIHISGGDILSYPYWDELEPLLEKTDTPVFFYIHYLNIVEHPGRLNLFKKDRLTVRIPVIFPFDEEKMKRAFLNLYEAGIQYDLIAIIQSNEEYALLREILERLSDSVSIPGVMYLPFYNGSNTGFFKDIFYVTRGDFKDKRPQNRDIYVNSTLNRVFFGKLWIKADGSVYSNLHSSKIGKIGEYSVYDCVFRELQRGESWWKTRKRVLPCKNCNYEGLCPSISAYNYAIGRYDLCFLSQDN